MPNETPKPERERDALVNQIETLGLSSEVVTSTHIWNPPVSKEESLRGRFVYLLEAKPTQWHPGFLWGNLLKLVALRLGRSPALNSAVTCYVAGCLAYQDRTDENLRLAWRSYGSALRSMQRAISCHEVGSVVLSETISAMKLLTGFEVGLHVSVVDGANVDSGHARHEIVSVDSTLSGTWCLTRNEGTRRKRGRHVPLALLLCPIS
jgi:hypothetical protein